MFPHWETLIVFSLTAGLASFFAMVIVEAWSLGAGGYVLWLIVGVVPAFFLSASVILAVHFVSALIYKIFHR